MNFANLLEIKNTKSERNEPEFSLVFSFPENSGVLKFVSEIPGNLFEKSREFRRIARKLLYFAAQNMKAHPKVSGEKYYDCESVAKNLKTFLEDETELFPFDVYEVGILGVKENKPISFFKNSDFSDHYVNFLVMPDPRNMNQKIFLAVYMTVNYNFYDSCSVFCVTAKSLSELKRKLKKVYGTTNDWENYED